jgi:hypothetical protein
MSDRNESPKAERAPSARRAVPPVELYPWLEPRRFRWLSQKQAA